MKSIAEAIKKLSPEHLNELAMLLRCKPAETSVLKYMQSAAYIFEALRTLSETELGIAQEIYCGNDGITLAELSKRLNVAVSEAEAAAEGLANKLLAYNIKNRQLLTNKTDKVYAIKEVSAILNLMQIGSFAQKVNKLREAAELKAADVELLKKAKAAGVEELIRFLAAQGGVASFYTAEKIFSGGTLIPLLEKAFDAGAASPCYTLAPVLRANIVINPNLLAAVSGEAAPVRATPVDNGYRFVVNMLHVYDIVSSYGLFITQQMQFRKVDYKRVADSMLAETNCDGSSADPDVLCQTALFFFAALKVLHIDKAAAKINISRLRKYFDAPDAFTGVMLQALDEAGRIHEVFAPPYPMPDYKTVALIIKELYVLQGASKTYLETALLTAALSEEGGSEERLCKAAENIGEIKQRIAAGIRLLCITGTIKIAANGEFSLSEAGYETAKFLFKLKVSELPSPQENKIYVNSDYSMLVPAQEVPPLCVYQILFWCEVIKDDVLLTVKISNASLLTAQKRGASVEKFIDTLKACSKDAIPGNMEFQINEWARQTLKVTISDAVIVNTSQADFLNELVYAHTKSGRAASAIKVLSPTCAAISRDCIDEIVKIAAKHNGIVSLFEEPENEE